MENEGKKKNILLIGILIFVGVVIIGIFVFNIKKVLSMFVYLLYTALILGVIGMVVYLVYYIFFKKQPVDITYVTAKKIIKSAKLSKPPYIKDLYISGDKEHQRVKIGTITGYCRIQNYRPTYQIIDAKDKWVHRRYNKKLQSYEIIKQDKKTKEFGQTELEQDESYNYGITVHVEYMQEDIITFKKHPLNVMEDDKILRLDPDDHSELVGDVTVNGFSLTHHGEYFYLNKDHLDFKMIDQTIYNEGERGTGILFVSRMVPLLDEASGLDSRHKKELEAQRLVNVQNPIMPK